MQFVCPRSWGADCVSGRGQDLTLPQGPSLSHPPWDIGQTALPQLINSQKGQTYQRPTLGICLLSSQNGEHLARAAQIGRFQQNSSGLNWNWNWTAKSSLFWWWDWDQIDPDKRTKKMDTHLVKTNVVYLEWKELRWITGSLNIPSAFTEKAKRGQQKAPMLPMPSQTGIYIFICARLWSHMICYTLEP